METTLTISYSIDIVSPVESEIVRVVSLSTTEITDITGFKNLILKNTLTCCRIYPNRFQSLKWYRMRFETNNRRKKGTEQDQTALVCKLILLYTLCEVILWSHTAK